MRVTGIPLLCHDNEIWSKFDLEFKYCPCTRPLVFQCRKYMYIYIYIILSCWNSSPKQVDAPRTSQTRRRRVDHIGCCGTSRDHSFPRFSRFLGSPIFLPCKKCSEDSIKLLRKVWILVINALKCLVACTKCSESEVGRGKMCMWWGCQPNGWKSNVEWALRFSATLPGVRSFL